MKRRTILKGVLSFIPSLLGLPLLIENTNKSYNILDLPIQRDPLRYKKGNWKIEDDWTSSEEAYSIVHITTEMPEVINSKVQFNLPDLSPDKFAIMCKPQDKQKYEQMVKGWSRQSQRITLDKLKYSNFLQSNI